MVNRFFTCGDGSKPWYLVNPKIAGKWMFIPLKMVLIGIDPYLCFWFQHHLVFQLAGRVGPALGILQDLLKFLFSEAAKDLLGDAHRCVDMGYERSKNAHFISFSLGRF